jgi:hypothetical protein
MPQASSGSLFAHIASQGEAIDHLKESAASCIYFARVIDRKQRDSCDFGESLSASG